MNSCKESKRLIINTFNCVQADGDWRISDGVVFVLTSDLLLLREVEMKKEIDVEYR